MVLHLHPTTDQSLPSERHRNGRRQQIRHKMAVGSYIVVADNAELNKWRSAMFDTGWSSSVDRSHGEIRLYKVRKMADSEWKR